MLHHAVLLQAFCMAQQQLHTSVSQLECNKGFLSEMFSAYHDYKNHGSSFELLRKVGLSTAACIDLPVGLTEASVCIARCHVIQCCKRMLLCSIPYCAAGKVSKQWSSCRAIAICF